jgi:hypothetical protein
VVHDREGYADESTYESLAELSWDTFPGFSSQPDVRNCTAMTRGFRVAYWNLAVMRPERGYRSETESLQYLVNGSKRYKIQQPSTQSASF